MSDDADKTVLLTHGQPMIVILSGGSRHLDHFARMVVVRPGSALYLETCEGRRFLVSSRGRIPGWMVAGDDEYVATLEEMVTELTKERDEEREFGEEQCDLAEEAQRELEPVKAEAALLRSALEEVTSIGFVRCIDHGYAVDTALRLFPVEKRPS